MTLLPLIMQVLLGRQLNSPLTLVTQATSDSVVGMAQGCTRRTTFSTNSTLAGQLRVHEVDTARLRSLRHCGTNAAHECISEPHLSEVEMVLCCQELVFSTRVLQVPECDVTDRIKTCNATSPTNQQVIAGLGWLQQDRQVDLKVLPTAGERQEELAVAGLI